MNPAALAALWHRTRAALIEAFPDIDPETLADTIDGETGAMDAVASLIRDAEEDKAMVAGLRDHITALTRRKDRLADRAAKRKAAALALMQEMGERKITRPDFTATVASGPAGARIVDEAALPAWVWRVQSPVLDTRGIREKLIAGVDVPGAVLANGEPHLRVLT